MNRDQAALRIALLQVLANARAKIPAPGGASGKRLRDCLQLKSVLELELPLRHLYGQGYVDASERVFVITDKGLQYLSDLDGDWPHHSLVPRRPLPTAGGGEVALALPEPPIESDEPTDEWSVQ